MRRVRRRVVVVVVRRRGVVVVRRQSWRCAWRRGRGVAWSSVASSS
ncbi:hypothetical protein ACXZ9C_10805 [Streptococcus agalactiae]